MTLTGKGREFIDALVARDFERLSAAMAPTVRFRGLITKGPIEENGPSDVVGRFRAWYGDADRIDVLQTAVTELADRFRVTYRLRVHGPTPAGEGVHLIEQHVFGAVNGDGIESLDLLCSGFRRDPAETS